MSFVLHAAGGLKLAAGSSLVGCGIAECLARSHVLPADRVLRVQRLAAATAVTGLMATMLHLSLFAEEAMCATAPILDPMLSIGIAAGTAAGVSMLAQLGLFATAAALSRARVSPWASVGLGALAVAAGVSASHPVADSGSTLISAAALIHAVLGCAWAGTLPALVLLSGNHRGNRPPLPLLLASFSRLALPSMGLVLITGVILARWAVDPAEAMIGTAYGQTLLIKLVLVAAALGCAAAIRRRLRTACDDGQRRVLTWEAVLALAVVLAAATLAGLPPAAHVSFDWPFALRLAPLVAAQTTPGAVGWMFGGAVALVVGAGGALLANRHGARSWAVGFAACGLVVGTALALPAAAVPAYPTTFLHPPAGFSADTISRGTTLYAENCAACHGDAGHGDGAAAAGLNPPPADLTAPHLGLHTHGDLYWWISNGYPGSAMPGFARDLTPAQRWNLIDMLMARSLGYEARAIGATVVPHDPWLPAIETRLHGPDGVHLLSTLGGPAGTLLVLIEDSSELTRLDALAAAAPVVAQAGGTIVVVVPPELAEAARARPGLQLMIDRDGAASTAWSNYRRTLADQDWSDRVRTNPRLEWLIDRFHFVRARWRSDEPAADAETLTRQFEALAEEPEIRSAALHGR